MSESLPGTAPLEDAAATSVEDPAPAPTQEVVTESAPGSNDGKYVEAARFNGLMGKFNQTQSALDEARRRIAELEAAPPAQEESVSDTDVSTLQSQVNQLTSMLMEERLESARAQAIKDFPGAAAFADLIVADSPEAVRDMAKVLHERVQGSQASAGDPSPATSAESPAGAEAEGQTTAVEAAPPAPVVAGGTTTENTPPDARANVVEAIKKGSFTDFIQARWAEQQGAQDGLVL